MLFQLSEALAKQERESRSKQRESARGSPNHKQDDDNQNAPKETQAQLKDIVENSSKSTSTSTPPGYSDEASLQLKKLLGVPEVAHSPAGSVLPPQPQPKLAVSNSSVAHGGDDFSLNIEQVTSHQDARTTLMIKNIPNKYSQKMLLDSLDKHKGNFDFFYLPIDFKNKCNVGYAFINFIRPEYIPAFFFEFNGQTWEKFNSQKVCSISYARIQGKQAMVAHFQNSRLLAEDRKCRPLIFQSDGFKSGEEEEFPIGPNFPYLRHNNSSSFRHGHRNNSDEGRGAKNAERNASANNPSFGFASSPAANASNGNTCTDGNSKTNCNNNSTPDSGAAPHVPTHHPHHHQPPGWKRRR